MIFISSTEAQNITQIEYFFDTDPGIGSGTNLPVTPAPNLNNLNFVIPTGALTSGFHNLYIRAKDDSLRWSLTNYQPFYIESGNSIAPDVTKLEYFIDTDPGHGLGINLQISPGTNLNNLVFTIDINAIPAGFHNLCIRARDANGAWGLTDSRPFYKDAGGMVAPDITKVEYYFDNDPGFGSGFEISVTPSVNISNLLIPIDVTCLSNGLHGLYIRARDSHGKWSQTNYDTIRVAKISPQLSVGGPTTFCEGDSVQLSAPAGANRTYQWHRNNTPVANATGADYYPKLTGNYYAKITHNGICSDTTNTVSTIMKPAPIPVITGPNSLCADQPVATYTTESGMANYAWSISPGGTVTGSGSSTDTSITINWTGTGTRWVKVNYTALNGCQAVNPTQFNVTINPLPLPLINGSSNGCYNTPGTIYATSTGMTDYYWDISSGGTITGSRAGNSINVTWNSTGAQWVSAIYTDTHGCRAAASTVYPVQVIPLPVPTLAGEDTVCSGTSGWVYATETGKSNYTWSVSPGNTITVGGTSSSPTATVTWNSAGPQWIRVNYVNEFGCTALVAKQFDVFVKQTPTPVISGPGSVCIGTSNVVYTTETGMTNYVWSISTGGMITGGGGSSDNSITITWNSTGARWVKVNYTNGTGCVANLPTQYNVTVSSIPIPTMSGSQSACLNTPISYTTQASMTNYIWSFAPDGIVVTGGTTASNSITIKWATLGAKTVSVNYTNGSGCTATSPTVKNIEVFAVPTPVISGPNSVCKSSTGNVYATETGMSLYTWTVSPGGTIVGGSSGSSVSITWNTVGNQYVRVNYGNANGCRALSATQYNVVVKAVPVPVISGAITACQGASGVQYSTESGMTGYQWSVSSGGTIAGSSTGNAITVNWTSAGAQSVSVNYNAVNGCAAVTPTSLNVTVSPLPAIAGAITGPAQVIQGQTGVGYSVGTLANATGYAWSLPSGATLVSGANTSNIVVDYGAAAISGNITVHGTNACGNGPESPAMNVQVVPTNATLQGVILGSGQVNCYSAVQTITIAGNGTSFTIQSGGSATMVAGQKISYLPHTMVTSGGYMHGYITSSGQYCGTQSAPLMAVVTGQEAPVSFAVGTSVKVYPNPTTGNFILELKGNNPLGKSDVMIYNMRGEKLLFYEMNSETRHEFSLSTMPSGLYFIHILTGTRAEIVKIIKQ